MNLTKYEKIAPVFLAVSVYLLPYVSLVWCFFEIWERNWLTAFIMYSLFILGWWTKELILASNDPNKYTT